MGPSIIKLKRVRKIVKFAHPHATEFKPVRPAENPIKLNEKKIIVTSKSQVGRRIPKKDKNKSEIIKCIESTKAQPKYITPMIKFRKITEEISKLSLEIENIMNLNYSKAIPNNSLRRSATPPPVFPIRKQSFITPLKLPKFKY